jgi:hypothetical protein
MFLLCSLWMCSSKPPLQQAASQPLGTTSHVLCSYWATGLWRLEGRCLHSFIKNTTSLGIGLAALQESKSNAYYSVKPLVDGHLRCCLIQDLHSMLWG